MGKESKKPYVGSNAGIFTASIPLQNPSRNALPTPLHYSMHLPKYMYIQPARVSSRSYDYQNHTLYNTHIYIYKIGEFREGNHA